MGPEFNLVEKPCVQILVDLGYRYLRPQEPEATVNVALGRVIDGDNLVARDGNNQVLLRDEVITALQRINGISEDDAQAAGWRSVRVCPSRPGIYIRVFGHPGASKI